MSRWHDRSSAGIAAWANLSLEERLADRMSDILLAAHEIHELAVNAPDRSDLHGLSKVAQRIYDEASSAASHLPAPRDIPERDPELAAVLNRIARALEEIAPLHGLERDITLGWIEQLAATEALSLFYEVQRLDALVGHRSDDA